MNANRNKPASPASPALSGPVQTDPDPAERLEKDRYRVFIEDVTDGVYETDLKGNFLFFNNAFARIFGYPREEMLGRNFREFMDRDTAASAFESFNKVYRTGADIGNIIWDISRKDGEHRILEISASRVTDGAAGAVGFRGIARDITENYRARERALEAQQLAECQYEASRRAELRYRAFLEFIPDPVFVFNLDHTVSYLNPAFERVFGWTLAELEGRRIPFVPEELRQEVREGVKRLFAEKVLHGFETRRLTKDGRILDIVLDGAIFYDEKNVPAGQVIILRDVTQEKRVARTNQTLFRIARALHQFPRLDDRLEFIARQVQSLLSVEGASVILLDEKRKEFYFRVAAFDDTEAGEKMREARFPVDKGVAGEVYRSGKPLIVPDTSKSPHFFRLVDQKADYNTRNMLDVPIHLQDRMIGVLCAVNKKDGAFDAEDVELLSAVASMVGLPIENARINEALTRSFEEVKSFNRAKDRVIHHLSHELKTPVSVLSASLGLLRKRLQKTEDSGSGRLLERSERNLQRILDMQYEIEDLLRERDYRAYHMLSTLVDTCADELEVLVESESGDERLVDRIRDRIETVFGPRRPVSEMIDLRRFVTHAIEDLRPKFAHRGCRLETRMEATDPILIPSDVLSKIIEGLVKNAVENTPDGGLIEVTARAGVRGPEFGVKDYGIGISEENQRLIFENYFTSYEPMQYASRRPYDFNAGGKGFDLLRMKIFSERYRFKIRMHSKRCRFLPDDIDTGPGAIDLCDHCKNPEDCLDSGGTTIAVEFLPAESLSPDAPAEKIPGE